MKDPQVKKQLKVINTRLEKLIDKMNKDYDACIQELLKLSVLLQNIEDGHQDTNDIILK
jgi:hypothetical protein